MPPPRGCPPTPPPPPVGPPARGSLLPLAGQGVTASLRSPRPATGASPAPGLDARGRVGVGAGAGRGGGTPGAQVPRSGGEQPAAAQTPLVRTEENLRADLERAGGRRGGGGSIGDPQAAGAPRCLTARSIPTIVSITTPTTTRRAARTRKSGSRGRRTGDRRARPGPQGSGALLREEAKTGLGAGGLTFIRTLGGSREGSPDSPRKPQV